MVYDHPMSDPVRDPDPCACTRRSVLIRGTLTIGAAALGCAGRGESAKEVPSEGGAVVLPLAEHPALANAGGSEVIRADGKGKPILVRNDGDAGITALSLKCTHMGCAVRVDEGGALACPCHGSRYAADGSVTKGPAKEPLTRLPATLGGDAITVQIG